MKKFILTFVVFVGVVLALAPFTQAAVTVATTTNLISADLATNAASPGVTTLGDIVITEGATTDFTNGTGVTLILTAPTGWRFYSTNASVSFHNGRNISSASINSVSASSTVTVTLTVATGGDKSDDLTIAGLQIQSTNGATLPQTGLIFRASGNGGTAGIAGINAGSGVSFGQVSQIVGAHNAYRISAATTTPTVNVNDALTVRAVDQFGNTSTNVTSDKVLTFSGLSTSPNGFIPTVSSKTGGLTNIGSATTVTFTSGVISAGGTLKVYTAETATLNCTDGTVSTSTAGGAGMSLTASAGSASAVKVETVNDGSGTVVPAQSVTSGNTVTGYSITRDTYGNFVSNVAADTWSLASITGGVVSGDLVPAVDSKSATFTGHLTGGAVIHATSGALTTTNSGTLTVLVGSPGRVAFTTQPSSTTAGSTMASVVVQLQDAAGNNLSRAGTNITLTVSSGNLNGSTTVATDSTGKSTFNNLSITNASTGKTLTASATGLAGATSGSFDISAAAASGYRIFAASSTPTAGASDALTIVIVDQYRNTNTFSGDKTLTFSGLANSPGGTVPTVTSKTATAVNLGTSEAITFSGGVNSGGGTLVAYKAEGPVTLSVTDGTLTSSGAGGNGASLTVSAAADNAYRITAATSTPTAAAPDALTIKIVDQYQNPSSFSGDKNITFSGLADASTGAHPTITDKDASTVNLGTATTITFSGGQNPAGGTLVAKKAESATLAASDGTLTTSAAGGAGLSLTVSPAAANKLTIGTAPSSTATAGAPFSTQPQIRIEDQFGNLRTSDTDTITASANGTASLQGTTAIAAVGGVSTFTNLSYNVAETITVTFTSGSLASTTSGSVVVTAAAADRLVFITQPGGATYGSLLNPQPTLKTRDAFGNDSTVGLGATNLVTLSVSAGTGSLQGTTSLNIGTNDGNGMVSFSDLKVSAAGTGKQITASASGLTSAVSDSFAIDRATVNPSITADNKVYDGATTATIASRSLTGVIGSDDVSLSGGTATFADKTVGTGKAVTATGLSLAGTTAGNYQLGSTSAATTADITSRTLTVSATGVNRDYDGTTNATVNLSDDRVSGDVLSTSYTKANFADKNIGTAKPVSVTGISVTGADAGNYTYNTTASTTANITGRALLVSAAGVNKVYDGGTNATANLSDNHVLGDDVSASYTDASFEDKNVGVAKTVHVSGISISGTDSGNYTANSTATTTADITARALTVSATGVNKVYDGMTNATVNLSDNRISGDDFTPAYTEASFADKNVATNKTVSVSGISLSGADSGNYSANSTAATAADITPKTLTVSGVAANGKVYDGNTSATLNVGGAALVGVVGADDVTLDTSGAIGTFDSAIVGVGKTVTVSGLTISGADAGNYTLTQPTTTATISAKELTVTGITANNKTYDGNNSAALNVGAATLVGVVGSDDVTLNTVGAAGAFDSSAVGSGKTVTVSGLTISGADAGNYALTQSTATANITAKGLTVSGVTASNKIYDGNTSATLNVASASLVGVVGSDDMTLNTGSAEGTFDTAAVGAGKTVTVSGLTISGADSGNYSLTQPTTTANITSKALTVSGITASNKIYDGNTNATLNVTNAALVGVSGTDEVTLDTSSVVGTFESAAVGVGKTVTVTGLTIGGADAGNYTLTQPTTTAEITPKELTVSGITANNKTYDGNPGAALNVDSAALVGVIGSDDVTLDTTGAAGTFDSASAGLGRTVVVSGLTISGADAGNYSLNQPTTTANIAPKVLTVSGVTAIDKVYDGNTSATLNVASAALVGVVGSDDVTLNTGSAVGTFTSPSVGVGKTVNVSGLTLGGADSGNYLLMPPTATATIGPKELTVSGITANNKVYDGNVAATLNPGSAALVGVVGSDDVSLNTGSVVGVFDSAGVGVGKTVSVSGLTISGADSGNYRLNQPTATANITTKELTVSGITADNKVYDSNSAATLHVAGASLVGLVGSDDVTLNIAGAVGTFDSALTGTGKSVTVSGLTISGTDSGNYSLTQPTTTANITAKGLTVSGIMVNNKVYDGNTAATLNVGSAALVGVLGSEDVTLNTGSAVGTFDSPAVGTGRTVTVSGLTLSGADAGNYSVTQPTTTANITEKALTVSGITANNKIYDGNNSATLSLGSAALVGIAGSDDVTLNTGSAVATFDSATVAADKIVTISGLTISGADAGNYSLVQPTATANITAKNLAVSGITADNKVYDGNTAANLNLGSASLVGLVGSDDVTLSTSGAVGAFDSASVGTNKTVTVSGLSISGAAVGNYSLTQPATIANITAKSLTVSGITANNKVYDGNTDATLNVVSAALVGIVGSDDVTLDTSSAVGTFDSVSIGTGKLVTVSGLTIGGADAGNYSLAQPTTTAVITAKALTVGGITANNKVYDGNASATLSFGGASLVGVAGSDDVTLNTGAAVGTFSSATVGAGKIVAISGLTISGTDAGNYSLVQPSTTANITAKELTVSGITANNKIYDGNTSATLNLGSASLVGVVGSDDVTLNTGGAVGTFNSASVDTNKTVNVSGLTVSGTDAGNYSLTQPTTTADISAKELTVSGITANNKVYDGNSIATLNVASASLVGAFGSDDVTLNTGGAAGVFSSAAVGAGKSVTVSGLTISGNEAGNYSLTQPATTADITPKELTVMGVTANNKVYDGNVGATLNLGSAALIGVVGSDDVTLNTGSAVGTFSSASFGSGKTVTVSGLTISGTDAGNYSLTQPTTMANITGKGLTVSGITANNKVYDGNTSATVSVGGASLVGIIGSDDVTLNAGSAVGTFDSAAVGAGKTVTVSGLTISGADAGNYSLTQPSATADITAKGLTVSGVTANNKVYDGTTAASLNLAGASLVGVVGSDAVTLNTGSAVGTFSSTAVETNKTIAVSGLTLNGADAGNYSLSQPTTLADITAKSLTVTGITASNKTYDGNSTATLNVAGAILVGVVGSDDVTLNTGSAVGAFSSAAVGANKTVTISGLSISGVAVENYSLTQPTTTADITAKELTVSGITANNKVYDGSTSATLNLGGASLMGVIGSDDVTLNMGSASGAFGSATVGVAKAVAVSGFALSGADAGNYSLTQPTTTADITAKGLTVSGVTANNKTYDGNASATLSLGSAALVGVVGSDDVSLNTGSAVGIFDSAAVGNDKTVTVSGLTIGGAAADNYSLTQPVTTANITAKGLTVSGITAYNKVYDGNATGTLNVGSAALVGVMGSDDVTLNSASAVGIFSSPSVGTNKTVTVSGLTISGAAAGNYSLTQPTTTADITTKGLTVSGVAANNKEYDGNTSATLNLASAAVVGVAGSDDVTLDTASAQGTFSSASIGTNKTVTVSGLALNGADASNYSLAQPTATAAITAKALTVTGVTASNKPYDGNAAATLNVTSATLVGVVGSEDVTLNSGGATGTFDSASVGAGKTVTVSGLALSGADVGNYTLTQPTTTADITAQGLTVTGVTANNKIYDGNSAASLNLGSASLVGVVGSDAVTLDSTSVVGTFSSATVGVAKTVTVSGFALTGLDAGNYSLTQPTTMADITAKTLSVSGITASDKLYDGNTAATLNVSGAFLVGVVGSDAVTLNTDTATATFDTAAVGNDKNVTVAGLTISGADAGNYSLVQPTTTASIILTVAILTQPTSVTNNGGSSAVFSVEAEGNHLTYQWKFNGTNLSESAKYSGTTNFTLTVSSLVKPDEGSFTVHVASSLGVADSDVATLTVIDPAILTQPTNTSVTLGSGVSLSAVAGGTAPFKYQWYKKSTNILVTTYAKLTGKTNATLSIAAAVLTDGADYFVTVSNPWSPTQYPGTNVAHSDVARITVNVPISTVAVSPIASTKVAGNNVIFTAKPTKTSTKPFSYQWSANNVNLSNDGVHVFGADRASLTIVNVQTSDATTYRCTVANAAGQATSSALQGILRVNPDIVRPTPTILYPLSNARLTNGMTLTTNKVLSEIRTAPEFVLNGTASDNGLITNVAITQKYFDTAGVLQVYTNVNVALFGTLPGKKTWTNNFTLQDGTNIFSAVAYDTAGLTNAKTILKKYFFVRTNLLVVHNVGNGTHGPGLIPKATLGFGQAADGAALEIGRKYQIKVYPGPNTIFSNWTDVIGTQLTTNALYTLIMRDNLVLNANFVTNPIIEGGVNGVYYGLFSELDGVTEHSAGLIGPLTVRTNRSYSGKIIVNGKTHTLAGAFNFSGNSTAVVKRVLIGLPNLSVTMHLDWAHATKQITGVVSNMDLADPWMAYLTNNLGGLYLNHDARFTMAIPPVAGAPDSSPDGYGYATMTNTALGTVLITGAAADGAKISQVVPVSKDGMIPFHVNMYTNSGLIHGWLDISSGAPSGSVNWIKTTASLSPTSYQTGFTNLDVAVLGSGYDPNAYGGRALGTGTATITVNNLHVGTDSTLTWTNAISIGNLVTRTGGASNLISGSIVKSTGLLTLKFRPTAAGPVTIANPDRKVLGVVLQNTTNAVGAFNGTDGKTGSAVLLP